MLKAFVIKLGLIALGSVAALWILGVLIVLAIALIIGIIFVRHILHDKKVARARRKAASVYNPYRNRERRG